MKGLVFAMLGCKSSNQYTQLALDSFFKSTELQKDDEFYLIDNDGIDVTVNDRVKVIRNAEPQSFAKNSNDIINLANKKDVVILSNDVVFTPNWDIPLRHYSNAVLIPSCNQTHTYSNGQLILQNCMTIFEYNNSYRELSEISLFHSQQPELTFFERPLISFYVFLIPYKVYSTVGLLDEQFGIAGGEDVDYRIRSILAGIPVKFISKSYLLHFGGKSSWNGVENQEEISSRNDTYAEKFIEKWGLDLANLCLTTGNPSSVIKKYNLEQLAESKNFSETIKQVHNLSRS